MSINDVEKRLAAQAKKLAAQAVADEAKAAGLWARFKAWFARVILRRS